MGLPELNFHFQAAAEAAVSRAERGVVALILRDAKAAGLHTVTEQADIPAELGAENKAAIGRALVGYINRPKKVYAAVIPTADSVIADGFELLGGVDYDWLAGPGDMTADEAKALAAMVQVRREKRYIGKLVAPNLEADCEGVVNFVGSGIKAGDQSYETAQYCGRVAGMLAGTPASASATYAPLPEVTAIDELEEADANAAVNAGKLILVNDGRQIKLGRAVTSKTTVKAGESEVLKKIKLVADVDLIRYYAVSTIEEDYLGKCANSYDNKCVLLTALRAYLTALEDGEVLEAGSGGVEIDVAAQRAWLKEQGADVTSMDDAAVKRANTGSWVFLRITGTVLDAMEDFDVSLVAGGLSLTA